MTITETPDLRSRSLPIAADSTPTAPPGFIPGGLGRRLAAKLIDLGGVVALQLIVGLLVGIDARLFFGGRGATAVATLGDYWWGVLGSTLIFGYFVAFESVGGRTPGKRLLGLRVFGPGRSSHPTVGQAMARNAYLLLWLLPVPAAWVGAEGTLFALFAVAVVAIAVSIYRSPTKQGMNDRMAGGTQVVKL
ncbi:MAG: RDD family protein [Mycobacteriaceae bacterium]